MSVTEARLRRLVAAAPSSLEGLVQFLLEGLEWPIPDSLDLGDVPLDWSLDELHLDPDRVARLSAIRQIPKLVDDQRFGVFVLDFEGGSLPIGAVRRVVDRLVTTARSRRNRGSLPTWALNELIFFCQTSGSERTLHVVALREVGGRRVVRVASWGGSSTEGRLDLVVKRTVPDLRWSTEDAGPALAVDLGGTGLHSYRYAIRTSDALARRMAEVARDVRTEVLALHEVETDSGPIRTLFRDVRDQLIADLTPERFADVYAQTMVYGLLTARITHPEKFASVASVAALDFENPFLDAIYARFRSTSDETLDVDELGLGELAEELAATDVDDVIADFGAKDQREDPVVHFYEDFLAQYDPKQRVDLGAFFTPTPVVRYIVRSTDHAIKEAFGLPDGAASTVTWREYARIRPDVRRPAQAKPSDRVVNMIDPATGTGTFLVEWLRLVERSIPAVDALDSMAALEISLASYAVAHLKVSLKAAAGDAVGRLPIYLADTLAPQRPQVLDGMADPISSEGTLADEVKYDQLHNVVIGNPPYDRDASSKGGFVLAKQNGGRSLFDDILDDAKRHVIFSHTKSLNDLYVYFWRWSIWKAFEQNSGPAVVSMITSSSWLAGQGFLGLRRLAREVADDINIVDLGGAGRGTRKEENVFAIQTPVAVVTMSRTGASDRAKPATSRYLRISGTRQEKLSRLKELAPGAGGSGWTLLDDAWYAPFTPVNDDEAWLGFPLASDLFPWQQPGCSWGRTSPVATDPQVLDRRWRTFVSSADVKYRELLYAAAKSGRNVRTRVGGQTPLAEEPKGASGLPIVRYGYRSFDRQWSFSDARFATLERPSLWWSLSPTQVFMTSMMTNPLGLGPGATVTALVPDFHHFRGSFGGKDVIPLYRDAQGNPNVDPQLLETVTSAHRATDAAAIPVTVERLFAYVFGVLAGADYTARFADELETPGPRVPLAADPDLFAAMVRHGERLLWLQTYAERFRGEGRGSAVPRPKGMRWSQPVTRMPETLRDVEYVEVARELRVGDGAVIGVAPEVWAFEVSGMPVVRKWLGYRTRKGTGKAASSSSPLDAIRPESWVGEWNHELLDLLAVLTGTLDLLPVGADLLDRICAGPLIAAQDLPEPPDWMRKPPKSPTPTDATLY